MSATTAFCLIEGNGKDFTVLKSFKEPKHKEPNECAEYLYSQVLQKGLKRIGIDAPLSLPRSLYDTRFTPKKRQGSGEITNPYLFRYTDYWLFKELGLRPMPPAGDRIGRVTARAIELLQKMQLPTLNEKVIEVYPKQIAQALGINAYKKNYSQLLQTLKIDNFEGDEHQIDALLAAYATMKIDHGDTVYPPKDETEGWCYILKEKPRASLKHLL